jgi:hypothetical protein
MGNEEEERISFLRKRNNIRVPDLASAIRGVVLPSELNQEIIPSFFVSVQIQLQ